MKIVQIFQPQRGSIRKISLQEKLTLSLNFDLSKIEAMQEGNDLLFVFSDGSIVLLEEFYSTKNPPMFLLASGEIVQSFEDMMASADSKLPQVEGDSEALTASVEDVLSMPVAAGNTTANTGGIGEYRDGTGSVVGGIDRLGLGDNSGIAIEGLGSNFLSDSIEPTALPGLGLPRPATPLGGLESWKDLVDKNQGNGMQDSISMFPGASVGDPNKQYTEITIKFGEGWDWKNLLGNDWVSIAGQEFRYPNFPNQIEIKGVKYTLDWSLNGLVIKAADGSALSQDQINGVLSEFGYLNPDIANINGIFGNNGEIDYDFLEKLQTGFKELDIVLKDNANGQETVLADLNFRDLINLDQSSTVGVNSVIGANSTGVVGGSGMLDKDTVPPIQGNQGAPDTPGVSGILGAGKDWVVIGTGGNDTLTINGEGKDRYHMIVGGNGNDSITATSKDNYFIAGNGVYDSISGTVDALVGEGNNTIVTGAGNDTLVGGKGNDSLNAGTGNNLILTGGHDTGKADTVVLTPNGKNTIVMSGADKSESLVIEGNIDDDIIKSQSQDANNKNKNDTVSVTGDMTGGSILTGLGEDSIVINGFINGSALINTGDASTADKKGDFVHIGAGNYDSTGKLENTIDPYLGDNASIISGIGNDTIKVSGVMSGGSINSGAGKDNVIIVGTVNKGTISTGEGDDTVNLEASFQGGTIDGGLGNDLIEIEDSVSGNGIIKGGEGDDTVNIAGNMNSSTIYGDAGNDKITIGGGISGGLISGGDGDDKIDITGDVSKSAVINAGAWNDIVSVAGNMTGGIVHGGLGQDKIDIKGNMTGGLINGEIDFTGNKPTVDLSKQADTISVAGNMTGGTIDGGLGNDQITVGIMGDTIDLNNPPTCGASGVGNGVINGGEGDDTISVLGEVNGDKNKGGMNGGQIDGGDGNDQISIAGGMYGGTVSGGAGNDSVKIEGGYKNGTLSGGEGIDTLTVLGGISCGQIDSFESVIIGKHEEDFTHKGSGATVDKNAVAMTGGSIKVEKASTIELHGDMTGGSITLGGGKDLGKNILDIHGSVGEKTSANSGNSTVTATITSHGGNSIDIAGRVNKGASIILKGDTVSGGDRIEVGTHASNPDNGFPHAMTGGTIDASGSSANNTISLHSNMTGGSIKGGSGDDSVFVDGKVSNAFIDGGAGKDTIVAESLIGGATVSAGAGDDKILIASTSSTDKKDILISGGEGNDTIVIGSLGGYVTVEGGVGSDAIYIHQLNGGEVYGDSKGDVTSKEANKIIVNEMLGGKIVAGYGNDTVYITTMKAGDIYLDGESKNTSPSGTNELNILESMEGGSVYGGLGKDVVRIKNIAEGDIDLKDGADDLQIENVKGVDKITLELGTGDDIVRITNLEGSKNFYLNLGEGNDTVEIKTLGGKDPDVQINIALGSGSNVLNVAHILEGKITITTEGTSNKEVNLISLGMNKDINNPSYDFSNVTIEGSSAVDIVDLKADQADTLTLDELPKVNSAVDCIKFDNNLKLDLSDLNNQKLQTVFGDNKNATLTLVLGDKSYINFGDDTLKSKWSVVDGEKGIYKFTDNGRTLTVTFLDPQGKPLFEYKPTNGKPFTSDAEDAIDGIQELEEKAKNESEHQVAQVAAVAMAVVAEEALAKTEEHSTSKFDKEDVVSNTESEAHVALGGASSNNKVEQPQPEGVTKPEETTQGTENILGSTEDIQEEVPVLDLTAEYVVEEPVKVEEPVIEAVKEEQAEVYLASEEIETSVALEAEELYFDEAVLEDMQSEPITIEEETITAEGDYELIPEDTEIDVVLNDLLVEYSSTDIPREEVEVEEGLYNSVAMDSWYASEISSELANEEQRPYTVDETEGIQFAPQDAEASPFTLEDAQIVSFELVAPSMEVQYDEQAY